ncbi:SusC/RagA family TonB-linked outer membrane protein [Fulvitalea axinellae]|uniref:SusC/RagA family TonB-linked outer membrane protein n=1 Tax=Fulvitalea axinellae TaxID=1182444 RepID=A0AAU9CNY6_9BACT|nr:SusC/RagA family TonB-linked outer membrane protein [Fulvitalea axinellae]
MRNKYWLFKTIVLALALAFTGFASMGQTLTVTGRVISQADGESLPGVNVVIKGTQEGTITDWDGNFEISCDASDFLVFSYIGFENQEVGVGGRTIINVTMTSDLKELEEVVVVGYGTQNKRELTGSIAQVSGQSLTAQPLPSFEAGLQGRASGVQVIQSSGVAGAGSQIRIRGTGSITAGGDPLYVIDGIPLVIAQGDRVGAVNRNPLSSINPNDIESVEILKDASAASIYGSRGANGVVIITTKKGTKARKPTFDVSYRVTTSRPTDKLDLLNSREYIEVMQEAQENDFIYGTAAEIPGYQWPLSPDGVQLPGNFSHAEALKVDTDWQDEVIHTGVSHNVDFSFAQGGEKFSLFTSVSYSDEESFLKENNFERFNVRLNADYTVNNHISFGTATGWTRTLDNNVPVAWNGGLGTAQSGALPFWPVHNQDGSYYNFPTSLNPVQEIDNLVRRTRQLRTLATLYFNYQIIDGLSVRWEGGLDYIDRKYDDFRNNVLETVPLAYQANNFDFSWNTNLTANYGFSVGEEHSFKLLAGTEWLRFEQHSNDINVRFSDPTNPGAPIYKDPKLPPRRLPGGELNPDYQTTTNPIQAFSFVSYFGRVNYTFRERYLLTATFRADGSSRFGENNKFGYFPSASLGWIVTDEAFLSDSDILTNLKVKVGYGRTGNAEIDNYAQYGTTNVNIQNPYGPGAPDRPSQVIVQERLSNPDISWETTDAFDVAIEFGLLNDRISGEVAYYRKTTTDLFLQVSVPSSSGWVSVLRNIGKLRNQGVEFNINSTNIIKKNFTWTSNLNVSLNRNKVLDVGGAPPDALAGSGDTRVVEGQPIGVNYLVKVLYVDPQTGRPVYEGLERENGKIVRRFETFEYDADRDRQVVGKPLPDFIGGFSNTFNFHNFDVSLLFNFSIGAKIYDDAQKFHMSNIGTWNLRREILDRWRKPGDITNVPRLTLDEGASGISKSRNTNEYLHDGSYLRMKNFTVGYTFPAKLTKRWHLDNLRVYFVSTNLFTVTNYKGLDPEIFRDVENAQQANLSPNVTYLTPPQARTFSLGLNVTF